MRVHAGAVILTILTCWLTSACVEGVKNEPSEALSASVAPLGGVFAVTGTVTDTAGNPITGGSLTFRDGSGPVTTANTNSTGGYAAQLITGSYVVQLAYTMNGFTRFEGEPSLNVASDVSRDFVVVTYALHGRIIDSAGNPVHDAFLRASGGGRYINSDPSQDLRSDLNGYFDVRITGGIYVQAAVYPFGAPFSGTGFVATPVSDLSVSGDFSMTWTIAGGDNNECLVNNAGCQQSCVNTNGHFLCACSPGTTLNSNGFQCDDVNECAVNNGGCSTLPPVSCVNTYGSHSCGSCPAGYQGDGITCSDVNECATNNGGCSTTPVVACTNSTGSFTCGQCPPGYVGDGFACNFPNACSSGNGSCDQLCTSTNGVASCSCTSGYVLAANAHSCVDVDECATGSANCVLGAECMNVPGAYVCGACTAGYTDNGIACTDNDECASLNGGCQQICVNSPGSYSCGCEAGFMLDSNALTCSDFDECAQLNGGCSTAPMVKCINTPGGRACGSCPSGYVGNGEQCADVDECLAGTDSCSDNAHCTNTTGLFACECASGFVGNGHECESLNPAGGGGCSTGEPNPLAMLLVGSLIFVPRLRTKRRARAARLRA